MMTPNAVFDFSFELRLEKGNSIRTVIMSHKSGAWDAQQWLLAHGVKISSSTVLNSFQGRMYKVTKLPYHQADTEADICAVFDKMYGGQGEKKVVDVHICIARTH